MKMRLPPLTRAAARRQRSRRRAALTFSEVLVVIGILVLLAFLFAPKALRPVRAKVRQANCARALRSLGAAVQSFAEAHEKKYPAELLDEEKWPVGVETNHWLTNLNLLQMWSCLSNYLGNPHFLVCPDDTRFAPINLFSFTSSNLSYFMSTVASRSTPQALLVGDRNLSSNGVPVEPGIFLVGPKSVLGVTGRLHGGTANLLFADGSVSTLSVSANTAPAFATATNSLAVP